MCSAEALSCWNVNASPGVLLTVSADAGSTIAQQYVKTISVVEVWYQFCAAECSQADGICVKYLVNTQLHKISQRTAVIISGLRGNDIGQDCIFFQVETLDHSELTKYFSASRRR